LRDRIDFLGGRGHVNADLACDAEPMFYLVEIKDGRGMRDSSGSAYRFHRDGGATLGFASDRNLLAQRCRGAVINAVVLSVRRGIYPRSKQDRKRERCLA
jgi:hypothetical protein